MKQNNEPVDYPDAIRHLRREEQNERNQIHSPDFLPQDEAVVNYTNVAKAYDNALQGRDTNPLFGTTIYERVSLLQTRDSRRHKSVTNWRNVRICTF